MNLKNLFKVKYRYHERTWPEPKLGARDIVWWRKGNATDGYWYKAESHKGYVIELGATPEEACQKVQDELPDHWWGYILFWGIGWNLKGY